MDFKETGFDVYSPVMGTQAELEANKSKLKDYELALATDSDKLAYKDSNGLIHYVGAPKDSVNTIEDLKLVKAVEGDVYFVKGFYTAGDGAHHYRQYDSTYVGEDAIEGWKIVHDGEVNVSWFGDKVNIAIQYCSINNVHLIQDKDIYITDSYIIPKIKYLNIKSNKSYKILNNSDKPLFYVDIDGFYLLDGLTCVNETDNRNYLFKTETSTEELRINGIYVYDSKFYKYDLSDVSVSQSYDIDTYYPIIKEVLIEGCYSEFSEVFFTAISVCFDNIKITGNTFHNQKRVIVSLGQNNSTKDYFKVLKLKKCFRFIDNKYTADDDFICNTISSYTGYYYSGLLVEADYAECTNTVAKGIKINAGSDAEFYLLYGASNKCVMKNNNIEDCYSFSGKTILAKVKKAITYYCVGNIYKYNEEKLNYYKNTFSASIDDFHIYTQDSGTYEGSIRIDVASSDIFINDNIVSFPNGSKVIGSNRRNSNFSISNNKINIKSSGLLKLVSCYVNLESDATTETFDRYNNFIVSFDNNILNAPNCDFDICNVSFSNDTEFGVLSICNNTINANSGTLLLSNVTANNTGKMKSINIKNNTINSTTSYRFISVYSSFPVIANVVIKDNYIDSKIINDGILAIGDTFLFNNNCYIDGNVYDLISISNYSSEGKYIINSTVAGNSGFYNIDMSISVKKENTDTIVEIIRPNNTIESINITQLTSNTSRTIKNSGDSAISIIGYFRVGGLVYFRATNSVQSNVKNNVNTNINKTYSYISLTSTLNIQSLDTPYWTNKMQSEGVYEDFVDYMDSLNTNPLTRPTEPQPSEALLEFAKKYGII